MQKNVTGYQLPTIVIVCCNYVPALVSLVVEKVATKLHSNERFIEFDINCVQTSTNPSPSLTSYGALTNETVTSAKNI